MTLDLLRNNCINRLQDLIDARTTAAVNVRASSYETTDKLALMQVEILSEARTLLEAQRIIHDEFIKLTKPEKPDPETTPKPKTEDVY